MDQYKLCTRGPAQDPSFIGQLQVHLPGNRILLPADMDQHKLCKRCELVTLDRLENGYLLHRHVSTLIAEAKRDGACKMCSLILFSLRHHHYSFCYDYEPEASVRLFLNPPPSRTSAKLHQVDIIVTDEENFCEFWWLPQEFGKPWLLAPPYQPHPSEDVFRGHLTLYSNQGHSSGNNFNYRPLSSSSDSDHCFRIAKHWLDQCLQNHGSACQKDHVVNLPTRLVDVGSLDGSMPPRLITTAAENFSNPPSVKYIALSYCWGKIPFLKTTITNTEALRTSIPWDKLPKTVRDAITVTRKLGFRYLWVDSLCIIQGTDRAALLDWQKESAKMHEIYGAAFITIAAAKATNAHEGLFDKRPVEPMLSCPLESSSENPETVLLGTDPPRHLADLEPLNTRGWALQEQILSSRILSYGTAGLHWKCHRSCHLETVPEFGPQGIRFTEKESPPDTRLDIHYQQLKLVHMEWKSIIEDYSCRNLTYMTDRLPALYGISELVSRSTKDGYFAGLWSSDLVSQLLWRHCGKLIGSAVDYSRASQFRAPSWSWASVDGKILFLDGYHVMPNKVRGKCSLNVHTSQQLHKMKKTPLHVFGFVLRMPSIRCQDAGEVRYYGGAERETEWISYPDSLRTYLDDTKTLPKKSVLDRPDLPKQLLDPFFLFLGQKKGFGSCSAGLILVKTDKWRFVFRRVGIFEGFTDWALKERRGGRLMWVEIL